MKKHISKAIILTTVTLSLGIVTVVSWYVVTPVMTVESMVSAAIDGNGDKLASYMDMEGLRKDMRNRASHALEEKYPDREIKLDTKLITEIFIGSTIDRAFSIQGARNAVSGKNRAIRSRTDIDYKISHIDSNNFVAQINRPRRLNLIFTRHAASWMLSGVEFLPEEKLPALI